MSSSPTKTPNVSTGGTVAAPSSKATPKDGQVIGTILRDMGVTEYEPRVIHQLLEFSYRYVSQVLEDAVVYSNYANKKSVDVEDVKLAVERLSDKMFTSPPPRDLLTEMARHKNSTPLPPIKSHAGPRLPPDRHSLMSANFKSKSATKQNGPQLPLGPGVYRSVSGNLLNLPQIISLQPRTQTPGINAGTPVSRLNVATSDNSTPGVKRKLDSS